MLKIKSNTNRIPRKIKDLINRDNACKSFLPTNKIYNQEEWYIFISSCIDFVFSRGENSEKTDALSSYIYKFFGDRKLFDDWFYENIEIFEENDLDYYYESIKEIIDALFVSNNYKYRGLFESTILEFNPLWNVDGVETTTRTLEQDGTIETTDSGTNTRESSGTDTLESTGTDTNVRTGTDTVNETGTDTIVHSGTVTDAETGTDTNAHTGTITNAETGTDANAHTGTQSTTHDADNDTTRDEVSQDVTSKSPFNDNAFYNAEKRDGNLNISENNIIDESDVTTFNDTTTETKNLQNVETFADTNTDTKNLQNQRTFANSDTDTKNLQNQRTYNLSDAETKNLQDERIVDMTDVETRDLTNLMTRDLLDTERIIFERHGNIGVTTTTKLLTEFREYVFFNFLDLVAHDVVNCIAYGVY